MTSSVRRVSVGPSARTRPVVGAYFWRMNLDDAPLAFDKLHAGAICGRAVIVP